MVKIPPLDGLRCDSHALIRPSEHLSGMNEELKIPHPALALVDVRTAWTVV
jgi:hypothetical protein